MRNRENLTLLTQQCFKQVKYGTDHIQNIFSLSFFSFISNFCLENFSFSEKSEKLMRKSKISKL